MEDISLSRGERTRQEILDAARQLFVDHGYHGTSMRQIAEKTGLALGGIYNHFRSKEAIFESVIIAYHPFYDIVPALNNAQGETVEDLVRNAARRMVDTLGERQDYLNLMFIELVEFKAKHLPRLFEKFFPLGLQFAQRMLKDEEKLRPIPTPVLLRAYLGLFFSYVLTDMMLRDLMPPELTQADHLNYFVEIFLHGILNPD